MPIEMRKPKTLINDSNAQVTVIVIDMDTKKRDEVFIQPMSRAQIEARFDVAPVSLARNPRLKVI